MSGTPRGYSPAAFQRQLDELRADLRRALARRTYVTLDGITAGEGVRPEVGDALTGTVKDKLVIDAENIAADALDAAVITGPLIRTAKAGPRVELATDGITAHGTGTLVRPAPQTATPYAVRARISTLLPAFGGDTDRVPALWFERNPTDGSAFTPPQRWPAAGRW